MGDTALIDEVREIRRRIANDCGNDLGKIARRASEAARRFIMSNSARESSSTANEQKRRVCIT